MAELCNCDHGDCRKCYPKPALVTSEDLMFYERSHPVPWPEERPCERTLSPDELAD